MWILTIEFYRAGSIFHYGRLNIYGPPTSSAERSFPRVVKAVEGKQFVIHCPVAGFPIQEVRWTKGILRFPKLRILFNSIRQFYTGLNREELVRILLWLFTNVHLLSCYFRKIMDMPLTLDMFIGSRSMHKWRISTCLCMTNLCTTYSDMLCNSVGQNTRFFFVQNSLSTQDRNYKGIVLRFSYLL